MPKKGQKKYVSLCLAAKQEH